MQDIIRPNDEEELADIVAQAFSTSTPLEVAGGGSKRAIGRPLQTAALLSTETLSGITLYEPSELVMSAYAGTPLSQIESTLAQNNQELAFEPLDMGPLLGGEPDKATIGAVFAANLSGSRRILAGAARDHFIGMRAVNGRGEIFRSGGRVMKNVTGYDLCRGIAGSWGTLAVMSEVTMKVVPKAEETRTLVLRGLSDDVAVEAMCVAMGTPYEVSGAVHLPASMAGRLGVEEIAEKDEPITALRLENFSSSIPYRTGRLSGAIDFYAKTIEFDDASSRAFWSRMRRLAFLDGATGPVWRLSIAPKLGAKLVAAISNLLDCRAAYDWSGGLIWLEVTPSADVGATEIMRAVADVGGHATLIRAEPALRAAVDVFQPLEPGVAALTKRIKAAFDPNRILNPGRMYADI